MYILGSYGESNYIAAQEVGPKASYTTTNI